MSILRWVIVALAASGLQAARIRGNVVDPSLAEIQRANVRVLDAHLRTTEHRTVTRGGGYFETADLPPGKYLLVISAPGFRADPISIELSASEADRNLGSLILPIGGCDAPGVHCHVVTSGRDSYLQVPRPTYHDLAATAPCTVDADRALVRCSPVLGGSDKAADFQITTTHGNQLWIEALNKARLAAPRGLRSVCSQPFAGVRLDGLGPGTQFCLTSNRGRKTRIYLTEEISPGSTNITLHLAVVLP